MNDFLSSNLNHVVKGDCLELFKKLENNSIDVVFTSPPYFSTGGRNHKKYLGREEKYDDYFGFSCEVIDECLRVSKKYVLYNIQALQGNRNNIYKIIGKYAELIHDILIWYKPNGMPSSNNKISNKYEMVLIIKKNPKDPVDVTSKRFDNVIEMNTNSENEYSDIHRAVMKKEFCDEIIKNFTEENDIVLDPFFGTGTTGLCCKEQNRKFIGFEIEEKYIQASENRLNGIKRNGQTSIFTDFENI